MIQIFQKFDSYESSHIEKMDETERKKWMKK